VEDQEESRNFMQFRWTKSAVVGTLMSESYRTYGDVASPKLMLHRFIY
jgi:hypothetical protein